MARIPQPEPLFAEPDHAPELETQVAYEELRTNPWLGSDDEPLTVARALPKSDYPGQYWCMRLPCRDEGNPSHQRWAVERFGWPRCCARLR